LIPLLLEAHLFVPMEEGGFPEEENIISFKKKLFLLHLKENSFSSFKISKIKTKRKRKRKNIKMFRSIFDEQC
jgi:hypothetical protein